MLRQRSVFREAELNLQAALSRSGLHCAQQNQEESLLLVLQLQRYHRLIVKAQKHHIKSGYIQRIIKLRQHVRQAPSKECEHTRRITAPRWRLSQHLPQKYLRDNDLAGCRGNSYTRLPNSVRPLALFRNKHTTPCTRRHKTRPATLAAGRVDLIFDFKFCCAISAGHALQTP